MPGARKQPDADPGWLDQFFAWFTTPTPVVSWWVLVAATAIGVGFAVHPMLWRRTRLLATWVHEGGHAVAALVTGRDVTAIRLDAGSGGVTEHRGAERGLGRIVTAAAGYPAPAALAGFLLWAVLTGRGTWGIAALALLATAMLPFQRSWRGVIVTGGIVGALWILARLEPSWAVVGVVVFAGYMAAASPRTVVELHQVRRAQHLDGVHSDADTLATVTGLPAPAWEAIFMLVSLGLPVAGLWLAMR